MVLDHARLVWDFLGDLNRSLGSVGKLMILRHIHILLILARVTSWVRLYPGGNTATQIGLTRNHDNDNSRRLFENRAQGWCLRDSQRSLWNLKDL